MKTKSKRVYPTKPMRWVEVCRAALIMGVIANYSKGETLRLHGELTKRAKEGKCAHQKIGGRSIWRGYTEHPEWNGETVTG